MYIYVIRAESGAKASGFSFFYRITHFHYNCNKEITSLLNFFNLFRKSLKISITYRNINDHKESLQISPQALTLIYFKVIMIG